MKIKYSNSFLNYKKIDTAIETAKAILTLREKKGGIYENFGDYEYKKIEDKFIDITDYSKEMNSNRDKLKRFFDWCGTYAG